MYDERTMSKYRTNLIFLMKCFIHFTFAFFFKRLSSCKNLVGLPKHTQTFYISLQNTGPNAFPTWQMLGRDFQRCQECRQEVRQIRMRKNSQLMKEKNLLIIIMISNDSSSILPSSQTTVHESGA